MTRILLIWIAAFACTLLFCVIAGFWGQLILWSWDHLTRLQLYLISAALIATVTAVIFRK